MRQWGQRIKYQREPPGATKPDRPAACETCPLGNVENWPCQWFDQLTGGCGSPVDRSKPEATTEAPQ